MTTSKPLKTIVFVSPENSNIALNLFAGDHEATLATSLAQAQNLISNNYELIVAATCFDESRMFDLLRFCKATPAIQAIPFVAMRIDGLNMDDMTHQSIQIATKALGAEEYIDLQRLPGGMHQKITAFRELIEMLIAKKRFAI
jgi:hypothetical protein